MMQAQNRIHLNRRGLTELVLGCAFFSLLTLVLWSWYVNGGHVQALDSAVEPQSSLAPYILHNPAIQVAAVVAEFAILLAVTLALVPPIWWLHTDALRGVQTAKSPSPLRWLSQKIHSNASQTEQPPDQPVAYNTAGEPIYYEQAGVAGTAPNPFAGLPPGQQVGAPAQPGQAIPGQPVPGQPVPGQPVPGQLLPGQKQPVQPMPGQPVPVQPVPGQPAPGQAAPGQPAPGQPGQALPVATQPATVTEVKPGQAVTAPAAPPPQPVSDVLNFETTEEEDPLADIANMKDLLSSAFEDDSADDPDREALSRTLDDIEAVVLLRDARRIVATFRQ